MVADQSTESLFFVINTVVTQKGLSGSNNCMKTTLTPPFSHKLSHKKKKEKKSLKKKEMKKKVEKRKENGKIV